MCKRGGGENDRGKEKSLEIIWNIYEYVMSMVKVFKVKVIILEE